MYVPWLVDLMPTASWVQLILGLSILNNVMSWWHSFRLWRIDTLRVRIERATVPVQLKGYSWGYHRDARERSTAPRKCVPSLTPL